MFKSMLRCFLVIVGFGASVCAGAGPGIPRAHPPVILSVSMDSAVNAMIITGRHFGNTAPTVSLAYRVLEVKTFRKTESWWPFPPVSSPVPIASR